MTCTVPNGEAGLYPIDVNILPYGYVSVMTDAVSGPLRNASLPLSVYPLLMISPTMDSITPSIGSTAGGTALTIKGTGFTNIIEHIQVTLGTLPCEIITASRTEITCQSTASIHPNIVSLSVSINDHQATGTVWYTYDTNATPSITSVSEGENLIGGSSITITGTNFIPGSTRVQILANNESFIFSDNYQYDCQWTSLTATSITCTVPNRSAGTYNVILLVTGKGLSSGTSSVNYALQISSFTPLQCGLGSGITLNISGVGFGASIKVMICNSNCAITNVTINSVSCILEASTIDTSCPVLVSYNGQHALSTNANFTFLSSLTPEVASINPSLGGTGGGNLLTIYGNGFWPQGITHSSQILPHDVQVFIDSSPCIIHSINETTIVCRTTQHKTTIAALVRVFVRGKGLALSEGIYYEYIDLWSSPYTWGGSSPPIQGDSVYIKRNQVVFLDIDTPILNLILIEGELVFQDTRDLHLQAKYIFINHGKLQIGTEENPFRHKAIITLHGNVRDPEIPIYGAKVLGVRQGELDLHGVPRNMTWTRLAETSLTNDTTIKLQV